MTTSVASVAPAPPPAMPGPPTYSRFVRFWLGLDLTLCCLTGLIALAALYQLSRGHFGDYAPALAIGQTVAQSAIAVLGISGNLLLMRHKPVGFWLGCLALVAVCAGMVLSMHELRLRIADADDDCSPGMLIGFILTLGLRYLLNMVYAFALRDARRTLLATPGDVA